MAISRPETDITTSLEGPNQEIVMSAVKGRIVERGTRDGAGGKDVKRHHTPASRRTPVALVLLPAVLACGRKSGQETAQSRDPVATHDAVRLTAPAVRADSLAKGARHAHLKGTQTEAICTSLADVQQFYTPGQDPTQESLSCSMIFGGQTTSDVAVLDTQGAYVHVRLYDKSGHSSDGYMRGQALR